MVVVVVACCCCIPYRLALMLAPTFAPCVLTFAPYILTFGPCACGLSLLSTGANIPLAQEVVVTSCNLCSRCFFIQPQAQIVHLHTWWYHPLQLALVVQSFSSSHWRRYCTCTQATCTVWWWSVVVVYIYNYIYIYIYIYIYKTPLAHVVVSPIATCAGDVFPYTHWCRYQAYARATCTVWWCFLGELTCVCTC